MTFIEQTAKDYDVNTTIVNIYYNMFGATQDFYSALEDYINQRSSFRAEDV